MSRCGMAPARCTRAPSPSSTMRASIAFRSPPSPTITNCAADERFSSARRASSCSSGSFCRSKRPTETIHGRAGSSSIEVASASRSSRRRAASTGVKIEGSRQVGMNWKRSAHCGYDDLYRSMAERRTAKTLCRRANVLRSSHSYRVGACRQPISQFGSLEDGHVLMQEHVLRSRVAREGERSFNAVEVEDVQAAEKPPDFGRAEAGEIADGQRQTSATAGGICDDDRKVAQRRTTDIDLTKAPDGPGFGV